MVLSWSCLPVLGFRGQANAQRLEHFGKWLLRIGEGTEQAEGALRMSYALPITW